jgi:hypothetical protein
MVITHASSMTALVNNFILTGVTASNIVYTGDSSAVGSFTGGNATNLGLNDGIILTTGSIDSLPHINDTATKFANTDNGQPGDALLNTYGPFGSFNAAVLEFDLIPVGNVLEFQYVFASEEYPEYVGMSFNDIFGFFISGINPVGGNYANVNIALIPGTAAPVCINNVNAGSYSTYYVDNAAGTTIVFDGFTTVLIAQASVVPGTTYHLKMALADVGDNIFDSGIFLKAQSMKSYMYVGVEENETHHFSIAPNPIGSDSKLNLNLLHAGKVNLTVSDISGKVVYSRSESFSADGPQQISMDGFSQCASGIYLMKVETDDFTEIQKIVK